MRDSFGREINYLRLSVTDKCNLRCQYCMPAERSARPPQDVLSFAELAAVCRAAAAIGISRFKVTGGEPLMRPGTADFIAQLRRLSGVRSVTLTTNGLLLEPHIGILSRAVDGINISLDAVSEPLYTQIAGFSGSERAIDAIHLSTAAGIPTRVNTVLLRENRGEWLQILDLARELPVDVRFIERMPIGGAPTNEAAIPASVLLDEVRRICPDLHEVSARGNGPAQYYASRSLRGRLGIIAANTQTFCRECNRLRLTSTGQLRPCLGHPEGTDLRSALRAGAGLGELRCLLAEAVASKPAAHKFADAGAKNPARYMNEIGG